MGQGLRQKESGIWDSGVAWKQEAMIDGNLCDILRQMLSCVSVALWASSGIAWLRASVSETDERAVHDNNLSQAACVSLPLTL